jgi:hypothetical protein
MTNPIPHGLSPDDLAALFTRQSGDYVFARWGRPIAPVIFGVDDATLATFKGAIEAIVAHAGHQLAETDPELGANVMIFFTRTWDEVLDVPNLGQLIPDLGPLVARLNGAGANQYRLFRFDPQGAIKAAFVFLRMDDHLAQMPAQDLALAQAAQIMCLWSDTAFARSAPIAGAGGVAVLRPSIAAVIRAAYAPNMPAAANDASHALRLWARL